MSLYPEPRFERFVNGALTPGAKLSLEREPDVFDVRSSVRTILGSIRHNKLLVVFCALVSLALAIAYVMIFPPIYRVDATIVAEPSTDAARDAFYVNWNVFRKDDARTEIELITAATVLKDVVEKEHLSYDDVYHPLSSEVLYLWEKSWIGHQYRALKRRFIPPDADELATDPKEELLGKTMADLREGILVAPVGDSNVAKLTVKGPNRRVSQIANTLIDVYLARRDATHQAEASRSLRILTEEADRAGQELQVITGRRTAYATQHTLGFDFQKEVQQLKDFTDLEASIANSQAKAAALDASVRSLDQQITREPETRKISATTELNSLREAAKLKRLDLQSQLIQTRDRYREDSPEVRELLADIGKLDEIIQSNSERVERGSTEGLNSVQQQLITNRSSLRSELDGTKAALNVMQATASQLRSELADVPERQSILKDLDRQYNVAAEKYQVLLQKRGIADVSLATTKAAMPSVRVVDYAAPPGGKWWPKTKFLYPGATMAGLLLGVLMAYTKTVVGGRVLACRVERGWGLMPLYSMIGKPGQEPLLLIVQRGRVEPGLGD